jgi:hypothetical protein
MLTGSSSNLPYIIAMVSAAAQCSQHGLMLIEVINMLNAQKDNMNLECTYGRRMKMNQSEAISY